MLLFTLIPDFIVLLCGSALKRVLPSGSWQSIDKLNFYLLFPALIFISALQSPPGSTALVLIGTGVWGIMLFAFAVGFLLRSIGPARFLDFAASWQTAWRFNAALALVIVQVLPVEYRALMSIAIGLAVPVANILAISVLSKGQGLGLAKTCWLILSNPFLVASVTGLFFALSALSIPALLLSALHKLAQAAIPLALLSIGAALNWQAFYKVSGFDAALNGIKLLLMPAVMLLLCQLGAVATGPAMVLVLFAALPTASAAHVLASVYGAKREPVARLIAQSTLLGCLTLPMWLLLLQYLYL